jgi:regulator of sirC expression with transglutaminase-like and TPR domain
MDDEFRTTAADTKGANDILGSMEPSPGLSRFAQVVGRDDFLLDEAALLIGAWDYPERDLDDYRDMLDTIAERIAPEVERANGGVARARVISDHLFDRLGYIGNTDDYYDPRNSFLCEVIDRRIGIPISLSVLYLEVSRRVGVLAQGVNFPGHFLVRVAIEDAWLFLDPFSRGRVLTPTDLEALLRKTTSPSAVLEPSVIAAASKRQIVARMLVNLAGIYGRNGDLPRSLDVLERLAVLEPSNPRIARDLSQLRERVDGLN